ncbi:MAG: SIMPL domain-containing protein [Leeuwenhoekiella sp.]
MKKVLIVAIALIGLQSFAQQPVQPMISVVGEGKVIAVPDEVTVRVRVETTGKDAAKVKTENDDAVDAVIKFTRKMNIGQNDVKTEYINLNKNYDYQTKTYNYQANQSISIKIEDLENYEKIMEGLLASGINNIDSVEFSSSKIEEYRSQARKNAISDAKMKAGEYSSVLGQTVGQAISISETGTSIPMPQPQFKMMARAESMDASQETIALGEMTVTANVSVVFELR